MKIIRCVAYFDLLGDFEYEKKVCFDCWKVWSREHSDFIPRVHWIFTDNPQRLDELIPVSDFVFFDYGGLSGAGHQDLGMSFARELEKQIVEHPSVEFILLCTMGKDWYRDDYKTEHVNLHFEEVDWHDIFDTYIGGINAQNKVS